MHRTLHLKFIANTFYGCNAVASKLLPYFSDMYVDSAVADYYISAPHFMKDLIS